MKQLLVILVAFFLLINGIKAQEIDSLLTLLEKTMELQSHFDNEKENKITEIKQLLNEKGISNVQKYHIYNQLINEYEPYNFDSTLHYVEDNLILAEQLSNIEYINNAKFKLCGLLATSGRYKEATDILNEIRKQDLPKEQLKDYYSQLTLAYGNLSSFTTLKKNTEKYENLAHIYSDSLLKLLDQNASEYMLIKESQYREAGHLLESKKINTQRLARVRMGTRDYSIAAYNRSQIFQHELDTKNQKKFLILSAISDIKASIKDNASLANLALILYHENNIDRAYKYINFAMEDALFFNSNLRFISMSNILPLITEDYQRKSDHQKANLRKFSRIISLLSIILLLALIFIYRQMKSLSKARNDLHDVNQQLGILNEQLQHTNHKLHGLNKELSESNLIKEQYIANFLTICSNYIDKLDGYRKMVNKQITARKVAELHEYTKSNIIINTELNAFYKNFDTTFLNIYPNFVAELNALLKPDEQIILKPHEKLNTELRIFALIRLGITDSSKIAKLLRYSVNTIYNYRVRIKNRASGNREEFEDLILKIDTCS